MKKKIKIEFTWQCPICGNIIRMEEDFEQGVNHIFCGALNCGNNFAILKEGETLYTPTIAVYFGGIKRYININDYIEFRQRLYI